MAAAFLNTVDKIINSENGRAVEEFRGLILATTV